MGRIKSGRVAIHLRDYEQVPLVEDHTFALVSARCGKPSSRIHDTFLLDSRAVSAPALRCLERAEAAAIVAVPSHVESLRSSLVEI